MRKNKMIAFTAIAITLGAITLHSCTKLASLLNFNLGMQTESVNITIPITTDTSLITVGPATNSYNVDSFIKASTGNQLGEANITNVKLASVLFTLNNADSVNNFADFESVSASFSSNTNTTPYTINIANNPDVYAATLSLPVDTTVQLKTYLGNQFTYSVSGKLRRPTTKPLNCTVTFTFNVAVQG